MWVTYSASVVILVTYRSIDILNRKEKQWEIKKARKQQVKSQNAPSRSPYGKGIILFSGNGVQNYFNLVETEKIII
jgi:hypothetical protein